MNYVISSLLVVLTWGLWSLGAKWTARSGNGGHVALMSCLGALAFLVLWSAWERVGGGRSPFAIGAASGLSFAFGIGLGAGLLFFYRALETGPASVVVPLTALYVLIPALVGLAFLGESPTAPRVLGIVFAVLAVVFLSR